MGKIIDITPGRGSYLEQLALAHTMLDQGKAADCLVFLNNAHCEGTDAEILRGKAFAELHNPTMSNLCNFKAIRNYMRNGGKIRDSFLRPVLFDVIDNCLSLKKYDTATFYTRLVRHREKNEEALLQEFTQFALSERLNDMSQDDITSDITGDIDLLEKFDEAKSYMAKKQYNKAIKMLKAVLKNCPSEFEGMINLMIARCLYEKGDYGECAALCLDIKAKHPSFTRAKCLYCKVLYILDDPLFELEVQELAEEGEMSDNDDIYDISELFIYLKKDDCLMTYAERLREWAEDDDYLVIKIYALALHLNGRREEARKLITRQVSIYGDNDDARFVLHYMRNYPDCEIFAELEHFYPEEMEREMNVAIEKCSDAADEFGKDHDVDKFAAVIKANELAIDYISRYSSSNEDTVWQYISVAETICANSAKMPPEFVSKLEDKLLDEDLNLELRELVMHALTEDPDRGFIYYVANARMYRMDTSIPSELAVLPPKYDAYVQAYTLICCKLAIRGKHMPHKLDDAAHYLTKAVKKFKLVDKVGSPLTFLKMFKFFVDNYDFDNGEELAKACCAVDEMEKVAIDDLY